MPPKPFTDDEFHGLLIFERTILVGLTKMLAKELQERSSGQFDFAAFRVAAYEKARDTIEVLNDGEQPDGPEVIDQVFRHLDEILDTVEDHVK